MVIEQRVYEVAGGLLVPEQDLQLIQVPLPNGCYVSLFFFGNLFELPEADRDYVLMLVNSLQAHRRLHPIEPVLTPEPVEAPREVPATPPAGAPGGLPEGTNNMPADLPKPAADYSADIPGGSDSATSPDVPKAEPAGLATTMTPDKTARWEAAMKAGVRVTDDGPPPAEVDDTPVPPAHKGGGGYERYHVECEDCGKMFGRGAGMAAHKRAAHSDEPQRGEPVGKSNVTLDSRPPKPLPGERWAYTCDNCQRTFPGERTLEEHERTCGRKAS